jgi:hypothetical protein
MSPRFLFLVLVLSSFFSFPGFSQDSTATCFSCCRPDAVAPAGIMLDHVHEKGKFSLAYSFMTMSMKGNRSGTTELDDAAVFNTYMMSASRMTMQMHMLMAMYGINSRLSVMAMFNYNICNMQMNMMPAGHMHMPGMTDNAAGPMAMKSYGLSDTKLYGLYNLLKECNKRLVAGVGVSLPTGDVDVRGITMQSDYAIFPYGMQLGTGTYDLLPSLAYVTQKNRFSWGTLLNANLKTGLNRKNYRWGNEYSLSSWISYKTFEWLSISGRADYYTMEKLYGYEAEINLYSGNDPSYNVANYGLQKVNVHLGANLFVPSGFLREGRILLEYGMPVYQKVNGLQTSLKSSFTARLQYDF